MRNELLKLDQIGDLHRLALFDAPHRRDAGQQRHRPGARTSPLLQRVWDVRFEDHVLQFRVGAEMSPEADLHFVQFRLAEVFRHPNLGGRGRPGGNLRMA